MLNRLQAVPASIASLPWRVLFGALIAASAVIFLLAQRFQTGSEAEAAIPELVIAIAFIILFARAVGELVARLGQPRVMGEVLGGILLGGSFLGLLPEAFPALCGAEGCGNYWPFSDSTFAGLRAAAGIGLVFYMFLVGLEFDPSILRERARQAVAISVTSTALPFVLGLVAAGILLAYQMANPEGIEYLDAGRPVAAAIFIGVSMSITAFPVLARILVERRMIRGPIGSLVLACAAVDDVLAWTLLAVASVIAAAGLSMGTSDSTITPLMIALLSLAFVAVLALLGRPVLARLADAYDEAGHIPGAWIVFLFVGIMVAAYLSWAVGVAAIFGAFLIGLIMPRRSGLTEEVSHRLEDFVVIVLLPIFFVISGFNTNIGANIFSAEFWAWSALMILIAVGGKWIGASVAAAAVGVERRSAIAIGALMNTRGLTELIVLNVGRELGLITNDLFSILVLMALVTTFMAAPALRLIDPKRLLSVAPEQEVTGAAESLDTSHTILIACLDPKNLDSLVSLGVAISAHRDSREMILVRLIQPSRISTRYAPVEALVESAQSELDVQAAQLAEKGIAVRSLALVSSDRQRDLVELARNESVDLVLTDGRRSLAANGLPGGTVGALLTEAECDVGVLIEKARVLSIDASRAVTVPFGGSDNDWAAVELGASVAGHYDAPLRLIGVRGGDGSADADRLLEAASLAVQSVSGVTVERLTLESSADGLLELAGETGLFVIGLSKRWREEGLGSIRKEIAQEASSSILFVRRGVRPGVLAPAESMTEFSWSMIGERPPSQ